MDQYPIIVEGDWGPENTKSVKNKLQIHFQSKKKSKGGDCTVEYKDDGNSATIYFKSSDIRDAVLSQAEHVITIDTQQIKLKVHKPSNAQENAKGSNGQKADKSYGSQKPDTDQFKSKVCKSSDEEKQTDITDKNNEQECGFQEPNQSALESSAVVLENIDDHLNREILVLLVENIINISEKDFTLELIPELAKAVVTFKNPNAAEKFLEESRTHERFQSNNLRAHALERSTCVRVEDLPVEANKMLLELYFEKLGGPLEDVVIIPSEQAAIVTFKKEDGKEKILKKEHKICDASVKIYPYFKSLDTVLYGGNRPHFKLPEAIRFQIDPAIRNFILKKGKFSSIKDKMSSCYCQINIDKPDVSLSPDPALLQQKGITKKRIDSWSKNALDTFKEIMSDYTTSEWPVSHTLWSKVENDVKELVKDQVFTDMDSSTGVLTLAGMSHEINSLKTIMKKIVENATNQLEREMNSVTDEMQMSPAMYSLLERDGLKSAVPQHLHIDYNRKRRSLILSGLHTESLAFRNWVLQKKINMKQKTLQIDRSVVEFLISVDCDEMSSDLFISRGITAVYTVENGDVVVVGSTEKALAEAEKRVNMALTSKDLAVEDQDVLQMAEWQELKKQLQEFFNTSKKSVCINVLQRDKVTVTGFKEPVMEVSEKLKGFIEKHSRIEEFIRVKSNAVVEFMKDKKSQDWQHFLKPNKVKVIFDSKRPRITLSGERYFVQSTMSSLKSLADALYTDTLTIKKAGAKKYFKEQGKIMLSMLLKEKSFVVVLQEESMLEDEGDDFTGPSFEDFGQASCEVRMPGGVTVAVRKANICTLRVDAVVNAANEDLKHIGGVALALLQAAGPELQKYSDLHTKANGPLKPGEAIITGAGRLPCKYVVHTVGPRYRASDRATTVQLLRRAVRESLNRASSKNCCSIAIPVISSGVFGCPLDLCTNSIAKEVRKYIEDHNQRGSSCKFTEIHLVDNNGNTVNAMSQAVRNVFADYNPNVTFPQQTESHGYNNYEQGYRGGGRGGGRGHGRGHGRGNYNQRQRELEVTKDNDRDNYYEGQAHSRFGDRLDTSEGLSVLETKTTQEGLKIILSKGNIQDAQADVIVNTISEDLDLSKGAVSKALLKTAGHELQSEITKAAHSYKLNYGEMVITDGYRLKCKNVFHVVCPFWGKGSEDKVLRQIIRNCLKNVETHGMASIAFPAIGTGNLGFPKDLVARIMMMEVQEFDSLCLREVTVIVHPSDKETVQCFSSNFKQGIRGLNTKGGHRHAMSKMPEKTFSGKSAQTSGISGKVSSPSLGVHTMQLGHVMLEVLSGDITKERTDAIVNSSNQTFSLKTGVSKAILDAAGVQVEQECLQIVGSSNMQTEIVTSSGNLPCRKIIHIIGRSSPSDIKDVVLSVLKLCESQQWTSIAFPALGTGQGGANPADAADAMVDAVVTFVKKNKPVHVRLVKILIFQANMMTDFHQSMIRRSGEKVEEEKGILTKIKDFFMRESSDSTTNEQFVMLGEDIEPAVFQLCGETQEDLKEARDLINGLIVQEHVTIPIRDPAIAHFTREDVESLNAMQKELTISVRLEKKGQDSVVTLEGLTRDVHMAESRIRDMIRKVERSENRRREAFMISSTVKWQYLENGQRLRDFDMLTNYDLEVAWKVQQPTVRIKINHEDYEADLVRSVATSRRMRIELKRVDLKAAAQSRLPSDWEDMKGQQVVLVKLTVGLKEYMEVEKEFQKTGLTSKIIEIERVQNSTLWRNYMIKKEELEGKNKHTNNEKRLFHGTGPDKTDHINNHGFNRSYAGMHGAMYGNGSYFAVDPSYSARGYSKPDARGHKRMYLARVLVGDFTQGSQGLLVPPAKSSSSADLYNSVTDNMKNPTMFVIFNDVQAYPEYLITFQ